MGFVAALYGALSYVVFLASFLYAIGFVGNLAVPKSIDAPAGTASLIAALIIDAAVLGAFAIQHSVMARPGFKAMWTRVVPASVERSTYVLLSSLLLFMIFALWQPITGVVWDLRGTAAGNVLTGAFWIGWLVVLVSTFMISHFELFGLTQVWRRWRAQPLPEPLFKVALLYRFVRHPIMVGFFIAFWATPVMTQGHLLFALLTSGYIVVGVWLEERDLMAVFGTTYREYRERVPMFVPFTKRTPSAESAGARRETS